MKLKEKIYINSELEEIGSLYEDYLSESTVYDGASFWSNKRVQEIKSEISDKILKLVKEELLKKLNEAKSGVIDVDDYLKIVKTGDFDQMFDYGFDKALKEVKEIIKKS